MDEERFDVIVVGGGIGGLTAAYILARSGRSVLLVERGNRCGSKNMTGGRLYSGALSEIFPGFETEAPLEREIVRERLRVWNGSETLSADYGSAEIREPEGRSFSVLRSRLDNWMAAKVEEAGGMIVTGVRVDDIVVRDGKVDGIVAGEDVMEADAVILADGVNSLLAQRLGVKRELTPEQAVVCAKEVIELGAAEIDRRFSLDGGRGAAWMFLKCCEEQRLCDGFLYTNADSVSLGISLRVSDADKCGSSVAQMLEDFKHSESISPYISGGVTAEYSAHLIPEGGAVMIPERLSGDGWLIIGDAAALCANLGFSLHGMDLAVQSARLAAETVLEAALAGDFSAAALGSYQRKLENGPIMRYMRLQGPCGEAIRSGGWADAPAAVFNSAMGVE